MATDILLFKEIGCLLVQQIQINNKRICSRSDKSTRPSSLGNWVKYM